MTFLNWRSKRPLRILVCLTTLSLIGCATTPAPLPAAKPIKIGLALGGGAARGFAHVGVIKALENQGIVPDIVVGTSAGAVVGALYAAGNSGFELQKLAHRLDEAKISDWSLPDRGVLKGEALQQFINDAVAQRPLESLKKPFAAIATDLHSGESIVFRTGNTGMAVRASATVPGIFQPVTINGHEYVDGGLTSPVPVRAARDMGADFVIAVDISTRPVDGQTQSTIDLLLQTFTIMGQSISRYEAPSANLLIKPATGALSSTDFKSRTRAIAEGEKATRAQLATLITKLDEARFPNGRTRAVLPASTLDNGGQRR